MGLITKSEHEERKAKKREAKAARRAAKAGVRKENVRHEKIHYLIVCEGKETEPNYFRQLVKSDKISKVIKAEIKGPGRCTSSLVEYANQEKERLENEQNIRFDRVWVVFDKDDFEDFNEAIKLCHEYDFEAGWTNEAFELWYYLHFEYLDTAISRHDYIDKIENFVRKSDKYKDFEYEKSDKHFYEILQELGDEKNAIKFATQLRGKVLSQNYAKSKPCTTVDILIEELRDPEKILEEINSAERIPLKTKFD